MRSEGRLPGPCQGAARIPRYKHTPQAHQMWMILHQRRMRTEPLTPDAPCVMMRVDVLTSVHLPPPLAVGTIHCLGS